MIRSCVLGNEAHVSQNRCRLWKHSLRDSQCSCGSREQQTVIEPTLDMWMREKRPNNMVINDPKGELLVKNYVRATVRGFQIVQFNLINAMKTDIYNRAA